MQHPWPPPVQEHTVEDADPVLISMHLQFVSDKMLHDKVGHLHDKTKFDLQLPVEQVFSLESFVKSNEFKMQKFPSLGEAKEIAQLQEPK